MKRRICVHCGREYVVSERSRSNVCSEKCRRERYRTLAAARKQRHNFCSICGKRISGYGRYCDECKTTHANIGDPVRQYAPVSLEALRAAKKQPRGVSDARWRMERSRRRMERECPEYYNQLPDPDRLG